MSVTTRTITVRVDGDATKANKALNSVGDHAGLLSKKILKVGGLIAAAFSVTKIIQFGKESVRAMMEDQKSAALLAKTLKNVTHARKEDIAAVEAYIRKTEETLGVQDDELRPAFAKIVRVTKDATKAQKLLNLALDISAGTGKDLGSVSMALSKALGGNYTALSRLDPTISKAVLKTKDLDKMLKILAATYGGSATERAKTFAFQMERLKIAFENIKEDVGYALLPALEKVATWMNGDGIKAIRTFFMALMGKGSETPGRDPSARVADWQEKVDPLQESAGNLGEAINNLAGAVGKLFAAFGDGTSPSSGLAKFINMVATLVSWLDKLIQAMTWLINNLGRASASTSKQSVSDTLTKALNGSNWVGSYQSPSVGGYKKQSAIGGTINAGSATLVGERGPEVFTATTNGRIWTANQLGGGGQPINVNVHVAGNVIRERDLASAVRDQIAQLMRRRGADPSILGV